MSLDRIYDKFKDRVQFLVIYIREAHPKEGWWFGGSMLSKIMIKLYSPKASVGISDPETKEERRNVAEECQSTLEYGIPTLVDDTDDTVGKAYAARPTRLYLVGNDGHVAYAGGLGPFGFKPDEFNEEIEKYLEGNQNI